MTKHQSPTIATHWSRRRKVAHIREVLDHFCDMSDQDGEILTTCLTTLMQGHNLTADQEALYRWWSGWLAEVTATHRRHSRGQPLVEQVATALATVPLTQPIKVELTAALERLRAGQAMTPRQAGLWGAHALPKLKAAV